ncbi:PI-PLC domain-containing protein [Burkholderia alba]|uniref:hypothetical protein n=1 Tax=Burkholderia alba TaxID=2683677 RepID=UPI002B060C32|nr:hypothetical protein [Burkholderia alba]
MDDDDQALRMTYRDNEVVLKIASQYRIVEGAYTVSGFSVTSGQDPDGKIYSGLRKTFGSDGKFSFSVGRKKSTSVANWFNGQVAAYQTTFNHSAGELNFAFIGTLVLTITGGILGSRVATYRFQNVALAQGNAGASNNWWFGGKDCTNIGSNKVVARGHDADNMPMELTFLRGGNGPVNEVVAENLVLVPPADWMGRLDASTRLDQIVMPGTHDAGMSETSHCAPPEFLGSGGLSRTQAVNVFQQLSCGSRYFDLRVDYDYGELVTYHRSGQWGCNGISLRAALDGARNFLGTHATETAIFKFSHIRNDSGHDAAATKTRINALLEEFSGALYRHSGNPNLAEIRLGDARGKMILVFDYDEYVSPADGRFRYYDGSSSRAGLTVFDQYSNTESYSTMANDQLAKWQSHGGLGKGYLFLLSWTLTPQGVFSPTIASLADTANSNLSAVLSQTVGERRTKPNVVYVDFLNVEIGQVIIQYNFI